MVGLDLRHTLEVLENLFDKRGFGFDFSSGKLSGCLLQSTVTKEEEDKAGEQDESDTVVKEKEHENDEACGEQAFRHLHNHTGS